MKASQLLTLCSLIALPALTHAGQPLAPTVEKKADTSLLDSIWALPTIYHNDENPFIQDVRIVGRAHFDEYQVDSDLGHDQDWIVRRLRIGTKVRLLQQFTAHVEVDFDPQNDFPAYRRLTDAYLAWQPSDAFRLTVGKQSVKFTLDGSNSSNELLTIDRSNIANNFWFPNEYISGISASGTVGHFQYNTGYFSAGTDSKEFGNFDAGHFFLASVGYDFGKVLGFKKALVRADYVYNEPNPESTSVRPLEQVGALVLVLDHGRWGVSGELDRAQTFGAENYLFGAGVMPWFNITDKLQVVGRYTYISSSQQNGVRLARYDSFITSKTGDEYHEIYGGLNYFFYGHRLKLQSGLSYATLNDASLEGSEYHNWSWVNALRISW